MRVTAIGVSVAVLAGASVQARAADVLTVTTTADIVNGDVSSPAALIAQPGPDGISLREALTAANATAGPHAITFAAALAGQSITPTGNYLPPVLQDRTTLVGPSSDDGRPMVTIDGGSMLSESGVLAVWASSFTVNHLRFVNIRGGDAISVRAGGPQGALHIHDVRIEDNVFENDGQRGVGIWIGTNFPGLVRGQPYAGAVDATVKDVTIARNVIRGFTSDGINVGLPGTRCLIEDLLIEENTFADNRGVGEPALELDTNFTGNRILRTRILRNTFVNNWAAIHLNGGVGGTFPSGQQIPATGNAVSGSVISQNTFVGNSQAIALSGGAGGSNATDNSVVDTEITNNAIARSTPYGAIDVSGGGLGAAGNRINDVRMANNTIAYNDSAVTMRENFDGSVGNTITDVSIRNTLFWQNGGRDVGGPDVFRVSPSVTASIVKDSEFAGIGGNIAADPRLVSAQDFHLQSGSPAVNAGGSSGAPGVDIEDRVRTVPDIGAYEFGAATRRRLTVALVPFGGLGTITSTPNGISCPGVCSAAFDHDTTVTLTATPDANSRVAWSGACSGAGACTVMLGAAKKVVASFHRAVFPLTVSVSGNGHVESKPAGIACPGTCGADFGKDEPVTLTASPDPGFRFVWSGACTGSDACTVKMDSAKTVSATFMRLVHSVSITVAGKGRVTSRPSGISCPNLCSARFPERTVLKLTAAPQRGYIFVRWSGACRGKAVWCRLNVLTDTRIGAKFARAPVCKTGQRSTSRHPCGRR